jgi:hypothetical protein
MTLVPRMLTPLILPGRAVGGQSRTGDGKTEQPTAKSCSRKHRVGALCQDGGMAVVDHVQLPDGRRLDLRVSGPAGGAALEGPVHGGKGHGDR